MTNKNHLSNDLKLDLEIEAVTNASFNYVAEILAHRHLKPKIRDHFVYIKDILTINFRKNQQEEEYNVKNF